MTFTRYAAKRTRSILVWSGVILGLAITPNTGVAQINRIKTAARLLSQGQTEAAEREARLAMQDPTTRPLALSMLGTIRLQEGKYKEGTLLLTEALRLNPRLPGTLTTLGDAYVMQDHPLLAKKSYEQALRIDPANNNARFDLAKLQASLHDFRGSLNAARPMLNSLLKSEEGLLLLATDYGSLKDTGALKRVANAWQDLPAPSEESTLQFGQILARYGMASEARGIFKSLESKNADNPSSALAGNLGKSYLQLGDLDGAERNFMLALKLNPACAACDEGIAAVADRKNNTEKALAYLLKAKELNPDNPDILFEFGKVCLERNLIEDALPALSKAASLQPDRDQFIYVLGSAYVARGNLPKAASLYKKLLLKHPRDPVLNYATGTVYYLQGNYSAAEASLKQSLQENSDQVAAPYYLSLTYSHLGQNDKAVALLRGLIKSHPQYAPSYVKLGTILVAEHHYADAEEKLEQAIKLDPKSRQAQYQLYLLFHFLGKPAESKQHYEKWKKLQAEHNAETRLELHLLIPK